MVEPRKLVAPYYVGNVHPPGNAKVRPVVIKEEEDDMLTTGHYTSSPTSELAHQTFKTEGAGKQGDDRPKETRTPRAITESGRCTSETEGVAR